MSKYTTQLRWLVESGFDLGLKDYPIFDEVYRGTLNEKLIDHYYMDEIGAETAGLFKFFLNRAMNEIMPYYNQLYESVKLKIDPLNGMNISETLNENRDSSSNASNEASGTGNSKNLYNDTPQGSLQPGSIADQTYLTNATLDENTTTTNSKGTASSNETRGYTKSIVGNTYHNQSELLLDFRKTILNIDEMVIEDSKIKKCFMLVY